MGLESPPHETGHIWVVRQCRSPELLFVDFFSVRVVQLCNKLLEEVVSASSVSAFISSLNSMCVVFQRFVLVQRVSSCFRAVVCAFRALLSSRHSPALYCFTVL